MAKYIEVQQAVRMPGLRLVLSAGVPGPWGEAAKEIFHVKRISYIPVRQEVGGPNPGLQEWTGQTSAPVAVWNDERPRSTWSEQLYLAERLAPNPPLIPSSIDDRILMFGCCNEICGETGFGWSRRLMMIDSAVTGSSDAARVSAARRLGAKYGYSPEAAQAAPAKATQVLRLLAERLEHQRARGSRFFISDRLSALDIYWAAFAALIEPLPEQLCPMWHGFRRMYTNTDPVVHAAVTPLLLEHHDFIYHEYLELPIDL
jgi:hypothetical protein